jgi:hypothetical protein
MTKSKGIGGQSNNLKHSRNVFRVKKDEVKKCFGFVPLTKNLFKSNIDKLNGCWIWKGGKDKDGYGKITLNYKSKRAHRVSYELFKGDIPPGKLVLHLCDNPSCVNPNHLRLGTTIDNVNDRENKGRGLKGEKHHQSKLTERDVIEIRKKINEGVRNRDLVKEYNVKPCTISAIKCNINWTHLH